MRWPIRNQILVPVAALLTAAVTLIAVFSAILAARRSEEQTLTHLRELIGTLGQSNFPLAPNVLEKMRGLSGADFVVLHPRGEIRSSTIPINTAQLADLRKLPATDKLATLLRFPLFNLADRQYRVSAVRNLGSADGSMLFVLYPEESWRRARWEAAVPPLALGAATLLLMLLLSVWLAQRISRRLQIVQRQVGRIAQGDFIELAVGERQDEIRELALSVNDMSRQLRQMRETVEQSERSRLLGQLAGGLAHQLRNAVTGARLAVQVHRRRCASQGQDDSLAVALHQLTLTEEQIKGFLSLGRRELQPATECDLSLLLREVAALIGPACEHAQVTLRTAIPDDLPRLQADVQGLRGAILNLALNALEAAGPEGTVELVAHRKNGDHITIEIWDNGPGPPSHLADRLGTAFVTGKPEGVGLGLMLVRQVAQDHQGQLDWQRIDHRTCFRLNLPLKGLHAGANDSAN